MSLGVKDGDPDRLWIEAILWSFGSLVYHDKFQKPSDGGGLSKETYDKLFHDLQPLLKALHEKRWDIIEKAATYQIEDGLPDDSPRKLKEDAKWAAFILSQETEMAKKDIIAYLETNLPHHFDTLPTSNRGMSNWWKEVGGLAKQKREW